LAFFFIASRPRVISCFASSCINEMAQIRL
jgi:hypothetical protein